MVWYVDRVRSWLKEKTGMLARIILTIASDDLLLHRLRWQLQDRGDGANRMAVTSTMVEVCSLIRAICPRLIVVHFDRGGRYDDVNRLLWTTTVLAHPVLCWSSPTGVASNRRRDCLEWE